MDISAALLCSAALGLAALALVLTHRLMRRALDQQKQLTEKVMMFKGLHPHYAAPEKFTPSTMSWDAYDELKGKAAPDPGTADLDALEQEASDSEEQRDYEAMLKLEAAQAEDLLRQIEKAAEDSERRQAAMLEDNIANG